MHPHGGISMTAGLFNNPTAEMKDACGGRTHHLGPHLVVERKTMPGARSFVLDAASRSRACKAS